MPLSTSDEGLKSVDETRVDERRDGGRSGPVVAADPRAARPRDDGLVPAGPSIPLSGAVLVVCTANVIRSPVAAGLLRWGLRGSSVTVDSAGVAAHAGRPAAPEMLGQLPSTLREQLRSHESQGLSRELIGSADVILTATRRHRAAVLSFAPAALRRTFTLGEFAAWSTELAERSTSRRDGAPHSLAEVVAQVPTVRATRRLSEGEYDIPDPVGGSASSFRRAYVTIESTTSAITSALVSLSAR